MFWRFALLLPAFFFCVGCYRDVESGIGQNVAQTTGLVSMGSAVTVLPALTSSGGGAMLLIPYALGITAGEAMKEHKPLAATKPTPVPVALQTMYDQSVGDQFEILPRTYLNESDEICYVLRRKNKKNAFYKGLCRIKEGVWKVV